MTTDPSPAEMAAYDKGARAERARIIDLASRFGAGFPADHPRGAVASFADYLRVTGDNHGPGPFPWEGGGAR